MDTRISGVVNIPATVMIKNPTDERYHAFLWHHAVKARFEVFHGYPCHR